MIVKSLKYPLLAVVAMLLLVSVKPVCAVDEKPLSVGHGAVSQPSLDVKDEKVGVFTAKYDYGNNKEFRPYLGTGLAYRYQPEVRPGDNSKVQAGVAGQAGVRLLLDDKSSLNIDYKYLQLAPESSRSDTRTNSQTFGVGLKIKI